MKNIIVALGKKLELIYGAFQLFEIVCLWKWRSWCHWEMPTDIRSKPQSGQRAAKLPCVVEGMEPQWPNGSRVETPCSIRFLRCSEYYTWTLLLQCELHTHTILFQHPGSCTETCNNYSCWVYLLRSKIISIRFYANLLFLWSYAYIAIDLLLAGLCLPVKTSWDINLQPSQ